MKGDRARDSRSSLKKAQKTLMRTYAVYTRPSRLPRSLEETLGETGVHPRKYAVVDLLER